MKILTDYEGRAIRLTDERLQHILDHPEMHGMEERIDETVRCFRPDGLPDGEAGGR